MSHGCPHEEKLEEIRCVECGFLVGFQERKISTDNKHGTICIYCVSEWEFFRNEFSGSENKNTSYIYQTIETDKHHYRRERMHLVKNKIRDIFRSVKEDET